MKKRVVIIFIFWQLGMIVTACTNKRQSDTQMQSYEEREPVVTNNATDERKPVVTNNAYNEKEEVIQTKTEENIPNPVGDLSLKSDAVLGKYTTYFKTSSDERKSNIKNAAMKINGVTLLPGETFSCYDVLAPITKENGYEIAGAYQEGKIVKSIGGGVCQISSTLYNAVLGAELEIIERHAHSMTVSYVDLSRDAAIAGDYKDFCFINDGKHPIGIRAKVTESALTFEIVGVETRNQKEREIEFETVVLSTTEPGEDIITYDEEKPKSYVEVTQNAHTGYEAELYKIIYKNGKEVDRIKINSSVYAAVPTYLTVGTKEESEDFKGK